MFALILRISLIASVFITTTESCSMFLPNPCDKVKCPNGQACQQDMSYYCPNRFGSICTPVAICGNSTDPCEKMRCSSGQACVKVKDPKNCMDNQPCKLIGQCQDKNRPGSCPPAKDMKTITSCSNSCMESDEMCEEGAKCCFSEQMGSKVCIPGVSGSPTQTS